MKTFFPLLSVICFSIAFNSTAHGGCTRGDCANGQGTFTYADGSVYVGQWKDGRFHGQGTFYYADDSVYAGQWKDNMRDGGGTYTRPSGSKYVGQWKNDRFDGQGTHTYPDGSQYVGRWKNNMRNGKGTYIRPDNSQYTGQWKNDKLIGEGILITAEGNRFSFEFDKDGRLIGKYVALSEKKPREVKTPVPTKTTEPREITAPKLAKIEKPKAVPAPVARKAEAFSEKEKRKVAKTKKTEEAKTPVKSKPAKPPEKERPAPVKVIKTVGKKEEGTFVGPNGMTFVFISPGTFTMGSSEDKMGRYKNETQHQVTLNQGFYVQTTEVTQGQWMAIMGDNPSYFKGCGDDCPVEQVSWKDVQQFIWRLNQLEGAEKYRLPTEAEWEYACRAGTTTAFCAGEVTEQECGLDANLDSVAWFCGNSGKSTHPVAQKKANAWGLYDMHGNVAELCLDWYGHYSSGDISDPTGPASGFDRIVRGGGMESHVRHCRAACRGAITPDVVDYGVGFRLVRIP
jgi:formylglycine-generating enzyme required for sulfatase activity